MPEVETQGISIFDFANVIGKIKEEDPPKLSVVKKEVVKPKEEVNEKPKVSTV